MPPDTGWPAPCSTTCAAAISTGTTASSPPGGRRTTPWYFLSVRTPASRRTFTSNCWPPSAKRFQQKSEPSRLAARRAMHRRSTMRPWISLPTPSRRWPGLAAGDGRHLDGVRARMRVRSTSAAVPTKSITTIPPPGRSSMRKTRATTGASSSPVTTNAPTSTASGSTASSRNAHR